MQSQPVGSAPGSWLKLDDFDDVTLKAAVSHHVNHLHSSAQASDRRASQNRPSLSPDPKDFQVVEAYAQAVTGFNHRFTLETADTVTGETLAVHGMVGATLSGKHTSHHAPQPTIKQLETQSPTAKPTPTPTEAQRADPQLPHERRRRRY